MYITDYSNSCIRKVTVSTGTISTIAGTGTPSYSGDNGPATSAALHNPYGIAVDASGIHMQIKFYFFLFYFLFFGRQYIHI